MAQPRTADRRGRRAPWWGPPAVLAVMALLVAGWPFLASRLSDDRELPDGAVLRVGPGDGDHAWFTLGGGWTMAESETTPSQEYVLTRGSTELSVAYLGLMSSDYADRLWDGLRRSVRVSSSDARLGPPTPVLSANGARGSIGGLTQGDERGTAAVYPAPDGSFAIRMIALAPSDTDTDTTDLTDADADHAAALAVIRSLSFAGPAP
ncbi:hypothetical protein [Yinghuangia sp. YIM S09857]|uniref:hypothetical protein n=1 Tax=Yinghuangia sp. YIM S09857 TaxID=3436929 RepID=UPI003F53B4DD